MLTHGAADWEQLGVRLGCPAMLCALRWHVLWLEQFSATSAVKPQKIYSEWERCVLYTVSARDCPSQYAVIATNLSQCADEAYRDTSRPIADQ